MKKYLILGTRKTVNLTPNDKSADFIVPFTSSGCTATCLYCYLVCNFNTNSYLRIFMNKDKMRPKGPEKYTYRNEYRNPAEKIIRGYIEKYLPEATISYIV